MSQKRTVIAEVPADLRAEVEAVARKHNVSLTEVVREALRQFVAAPTLPGDCRKADQRSRSWLSK